VEGDGRQGGNIVDEGGCIGEGCDGIVPISGILQLVRGRTPVEVTEEVALGGNLPTRDQRGAVLREGGDGFRETCCWGVYFWRGADEP